MHRKLTVATLAVLAAFAMATGVVVAADSVEHANVSASDVSSADVIQSDGLDLELRVFDRNSVMQAQQGIRATGAITKAGGSRERWPYPFDKWR